MPFNLSGAPLAFVHTLVLVATTTTTAKKSSSSSISFLIIIVLFMGVYFLYLRPQRQKLRAAQQQTQRADVGDEVVTAGGIIGRVQYFDGDRVGVEVGPGQVIVVHRSSLGRRLDPRPPEMADDLDGTPDDVPSDLGPSDLGPGGEAKEGDGNWWPGGSDKPPAGGTS